MYLYIRVVTDIDVLNFNSVHNHKIIRYHKMVFVILLYYKIINRTNILL